MSVCIIGRSNSGKSTIQKVLIEEYGYEPLITYTTRPIRDGEVNHKDYHFISEKEFRQKIAGNDFLEWREYHTKYGVWYYGSRVIDYLSDNKVVVLTPGGYDKIKNMSNYTSFFISVKDSILIKRAWKRDKNKLKEAIRRYFADKKDFKGIGNEVNYVLDCNYRKPKIIASIINELDKENLRKWKRKQM